MLNVPFSLYSEITFFHKISHVGSLDIQPEKILRFGYRQIFKYSSFILIIFS